MSETSDRRPPRARRDRRPMIPVIFLLVLALAALGVWWNVFRDAEAIAQDNAAACSTAAEAPTALDPATVELHVLNATDTAGLAQTVATTLQSRGFVVSEIANDPSPRKAEVTGVGELRFGPRGASTADYVALYLPGATDYTDTRADSTVDVVIGPEFAELATQEQVDAALTTVASATAAC
ncbi:LytR cell envelope-related transcriptional attenuator [Klenkia soli]|uniref:LytR cell envelope-related transcriptional attenuator n=1 Tax=Klenkia soli TaxID=1052260 RepID=A0A1H0TRC7_9ACTN|nr:LytR C-terminal domain-containing protein [Klenkia soli]SDP56116.1 LytR cell envelope-related transcriptional attenuator [Klenkia soli]